MSKNSLIKLINILKIDQSNYKKYSLVIFSKLNYNVLSILYKNGYILNFKVIFIGNINKIKIIHKYYFNKPFISKLHFISKPSHKQYIKVKDIWKKKELSDILILSTNKGLLTCIDSKKLNIGGELLLIIR